jgi:hypothetical protein
MESLGWSSTSGREASGNLVINSRITVPRALQDAAWAMFRLGLVRLRSFKTCCRAYAREIDKGVLTRSVSCAGSDAFNVTVRSTLVCAEIGGPVPHARTRRQTSNVLSANSFSCTHAVGAQIDLLRHPGIAPHWLP